MNEELLDEASASPNTRVHFGHKIISADFEHKTVTIQDLESNKDFTVNFDLCIGADGSYSIVRRQMMRVVRWILFDTFVLTFSDAGGPCQDGLSTTVYPA